MGTDDESVLDFLHKFQRILNTKKVLCKNILKDILATRISLSVGVDISLTRGLLSLGTLTVVPKTGTGFSVPARFYFSAASCLGDLGYNGMRYVGARNPSIATYANKGANLFKGMSGSIQSVESKISKAFQNKKVDFGLGYSFAIGQGFYGVGFGLTTTCTQKKGSKSTDGVMKDCYGAGLDMVSKLAKAVGFNGRRRRLLAAAPKSKEQHVKLAKSIVSKGIKKFKEIAAATATTTDPVLLETLMQRKAEQKAIVIGTIAIVGIILGSTGVIGGGVAAGIAISHANSVADNTGLPGLKGKHLQPENIGQTAMEPFLLKGNNDRCRGGLAMTYDFMDVAINIQYSKGPLINCIEAICKYVLSNVGLNKASAKNKCKFQRTRFNSESLLGNPLSALPKDLASANNRREAKQKTVYRWKVQDANKDFYKGVPWSEEVDIAWDNWTPAFEITDIEGDRTHSMCIQTRLPPFHDVKIYVKPDNDYICKVRGAYVNAMNEHAHEEKWKAVSATWIQKDSTKSSETDDTQSYLIERRFANGWAAPKRKGGCKKAENYMFCFSNCNGYYNGKFKLKFTRKKSKDCMTGKLAPYVEIGEQVKITRDGVTPISAALDKAIRNKNPDARLDILDFPERFQDNYIFEVVKKPGAGADDKCCSNYCDGEYCADHEGIKPQGDQEGVKNKCITSRESRRNDLEGAKYEKTRCFQYIKKKWGSLAMLAANSKKGKNTLFNMVKMKQGKNALMKLKKLKKYTVVKDGKTVQIGCNREDIAKLDKKIKQYAKNARDESLFSCGKKGTGEGWLKYDPDTDGEGTKNRYGLALLGEKQRGKLGVCKTSIPIGPAWGKKIHLTPEGVPTEHGLTTEDACNCAKCKWELITIPAKKIHFERVRLDNEIRSAWTDLLLRRSTLLKNKGNGNTVGY